MRISLRRDGVVGLFERLGTYARRQNTYNHDIEKRQGLIGGLLNGGTNLIGGLLGGIRNDETTTTTRPPRTTNPPDPAPPTTTTQAPPNTQAPPPVQEQPPTQAPPTTTQAPPVQNPPTTQAQPQLSVINPQPIVLPPTTATTTNVNVPPSTIQISAPATIPRQTQTALPHLDPSVTESIHPFPSTGLLPPSAVPGTTRFSSITSINPDVPTTFQTSTLLTPSSTGPREDSSTSNPIMDDNSGRGNMSVMTIIISVVVIIFGSLAILCIAFFISRKYIKKRKITVGFDPSTFQVSENPFADPARPLFSNPRGRLRPTQNPFTSPDDETIGTDSRSVRRSPPYPPPTGPLPPLPTMREKGKMKVNRFVQMIPKPPSLKSFGSRKSNRSA